MERIAYLWTMKLFVSIRPEMRPSGALVYETLLPEFKSIVGTLFPVRPERYNYKRALGSGLERNRVEDEVGSAKDEERVKVRG